MTLAEDNQTNEVAPCHYGPSNDSWYSQALVWNSAATFIGRLSDSGPLGLTLAPPSEEEARRRAAIAASVDNWPGRAVAAVPLASGQKVPELEERIKRIVDLRLRGETATAEVGVRFRQRDWGKLWFDLTMTGRASKTSKCLRWESEVRATGRIELRASDGGIVQIELAGPRVDTEQTLCPAHTDKRAMGAGPNICNQGDMRMVLHWECYVPASD